MDSCLSLMEPYLYLGFPLKLVCEEEIKRSNEKKIFASSESSRISETMRLMEEVVPLSGTETRGTIKIKITRQHRSEVMC